MDSFVDLAHATDPTSTSETEYPRNEASHCRHGQDDRQTADGLGHGYSRLPLPRSQHSCVDHSEHEDEVVAIFKYTSPSSLQYLDPSPALEVFCYQLWGHYPFLPRGIHTGEFDHETLAGHVGCSALIGQV